MKRNFICTACNLSFKNQMGKNMHMRKCKGKPPPSPAAAPKPTPPAPPAPRRQPTPVAVQPPPVTPPLSEEEDEALVVGVRKSKLVLTDPAITVDVKPNVNELKAAAAAEAVKGKKIAPKRSLQRTASNDAGLIKKLKTADDSKGTSTTF